MRYANSKCKFDVKGDEVVITGPYFDNPSKTHSVSVKSFDLQAYQEGTVRFVQDAFPYLSADDREFLISGMSPEGFDAAFKEED